MRNNLSVLMILEKAPLVKLYYQNEEPVTTALRFYHHKKVIRAGKCHVTNSAVKRIIFKFEATGPFKLLPPLVADSAQVL